MLQAPGAPWRANKIKKRRKWKIRIKIIDACINGRGMSTWKDKMVDLYYPDEEENYWNVENVEGEKGSYFFSGNVFINWESIPYRKTKKKEDDTERITEEEVEGG